MIRTLPCTIYVFHACIIEMRWTTHYCVNTNQSLGHESFWAFLSCIAGEGVRDDREE